MKRLLVFVLTVLALVVAGCSRGEKVDGIGGIRPESKVLPLILKETPLRTVTTHEVTRFLPIRHVYIGKDADGRELVVWGRVGPERYVYLDQIQLRTREEAVAAAGRHGVGAEQILSVTLAYLDRGNQPVVWQVETKPGQKDLYIDAVTGELIDLGTA
jgi:uncharacterized protein YpmB